MALHLLFEFPALDTVFGKKYPSKLVDGALIRVFWNDSASTIDPYLYNPNALLLVEEDDVWMYTGPRANEISNYQFCDGSTLNTFRLLAGAFPFAQRIETANAAACVFSTVCDAYIQNPILTRSATQGDTNGAVTIRGFSTAMGLEYTITNADAETPPINPAWQPGQTFTDLPPGNYIAFVRDAQMCEFERPFSIEEEPVYNIRFTANYQDVLGEHTVINILKRDYEPDALAEEVTAAADPLVIKEGGGELFTVLRGQECVISLQASFFNQYIELFTGDDREFRVDILKEGQLFWRGWIVPDMYQEPYLAPPYNMQFSATDGLGELKSRPFTDGLPEGFMSQWDAIVHILGKVETHLQIYSGLNIYETRMNSTNADDPLRQAVIALEAYQDKGVVWDSAKVLEAILKPYGATIRQCEGGWHIIRVESNKSTYDRRGNEWHGAFSFVDNYNPARVITRPFHANPFYWITRAQILEMRPAYKQASTHLDYSLVTNIVRGGDMKSDDFDAGWNHKFIDGTADYQVYLENSKEDQYSMNTVPADTPAAAGYLQTERIWVESDTFLGLKISFDYKIIGGAVDPLFAGTDPVPPQFLYSVRINDKHLNPAASPTSNSLEWGTGYHQFKIANSNFNSWQTATINTPPIPEAGWLTIRFYEGSRNDYIFINQAVKRVGATLVKVDLPPLAEEETFTEVNPKRQFYIPETTEATHGDVIPLKNAPAMYRNLILVNGANTSLDWQRSGQIEAKPLLKILAEILLASKISPVRFLRGELRGAFSWNQVLEEADRTRYMPLTFEYNDQRRTISGEFIELLGTRQNPALAIQEETGEPLQLENEYILELEG